MSQFEESKQETTLDDTEQSINALEIIPKILNFLQLFMCETLAKRIISMVLIAVGIPNNRITELCNKSVRTLKKALKSGEISSLFQIRSGGGRKRKLVNVEDAIIEEINNNNYHSK